MEASRAAQGRTSVPLGKNSAASMNIPMEKLSAYRGEFKAYAQDLARQRAMMEATRAALQAPTAPVGRLSPWTAPSSKRRSDTRPDPCHSCAASS